jgi:signal transduction histidine kinase
VRFIGVWRDMVSRSALQAIMTGIGLIGCGIAIEAAWRDGLWGLLAGGLLAGAWLCVLNRRTSPRSHPEAAPPARLDVGLDPMAHRLLLDAAPTPMLGVEEGGVRALNRAARRLFATDQRIWPVPPELYDNTAHRLRHEGRAWRIDRLMFKGAQDTLSVVALIDIEQEEHAAEARATTELIHVLGHELLNGLAPIASLAESGLSAVEAPDPDAVLLREILGTLARRADSLQRFTEAYRALARLPEPLLRPVQVATIFGDLSRLFASRCPDLRLTVEVADDLVWPLDGDQLFQALWALLLNAAEAVVDRGVDGHVQLIAWQNGAGLAIEVRDNGCGVPPHSVGSIFRPFHTTKEGGTGIGLSLARQIAHAHGGALTLEAGALTVFRMQLPAGRSVLPD